MLRITFAILTVLALGQTVCAQNYCQPKLNIQRICPFTSVYDEFEDWINFSDNTRRKVPIINKYVPQISDVTDQFGNRTITYDYSQKVSYSKIKYGRDELGPTDRPPIINVTRSFDKLPDNGLPTITESFTPPKSKIPEPKTPELKAPEPPSRIMPRNDPRIISERPQTVEPPLLKKEPEKKLPNGMQRPSEIGDKK